MDDATSRDSSATCPMRAFSLVELLVVIAIVAMLMGILLPALTRARDAGRAAICASNIRQLAIANTAYSVSHRGYYVPGAANLLANRDRWHGYRDNVSEPFDPTRGPLWPYFEHAQLKQCPEFIDYLSSFEAGNGGYGYNNEYVGRDRRAYVATRLGARSHWFTDPTRTVMFTDAATTLLTTHAVYVEYSFAEPPLFTFGPADPSIHFRHQATCSVAWLDAHVELRQSTFTRANIYGVSEIQNHMMGIGWFGLGDNALFDRD